MNVSILNFEKFKLLLEGVDPNPVQSSPVNFQYNFESGQYDKASIPPQRLAALKTDIANKIVRLFNTVELVDQRLLVELTASTSELGLSAELARKLNTTPDKAGNEALCNARMETIKQIVIETLTESLNATPDELAKKVEFTKVVSKPNQGDGKTEEDRKKYQYVKANIKAVGTPGENPIPVSCYFKGGGNGAQGQATNNYVGFGKGKRYVTDIPIGAKFQLSFDPLTIPDCVFVKYGDIEFLSPFLGAPSFADNTGKTRNFIEELSAIPDLKDKINAELEAVGAKGRVDTLCPTFFSQDGKVSIRPGAKQKPEVGITTFVATRQTLSTDITLRVFSPLGGTLFSIWSGCTNTPK